MSRLENWTIASSGTTSNAIDTAHADIIGFVMPGTFTGTSVTFLGSMDNSNFDTVSYEGTDLQFTVAANKLVTFDITKLMAPRYVKIVSGSSEAAERVIQAVLRAF